MGDHDSCSDKRSSRSSPTSFLPRAAGEDVRSGFKRAQRVTFERLQPFDYRAPVKIS